MEWAPFRIFLQYQNTRASDIIWVVFYHQGLGNSTQNFPNGDAICRKFIIAVFRNLNISALDQPKDTLPYLAHDLMFTARESLQVAACLCNWWSRSESILKQLSFLEVI
jgi:hypothetical protein